MVSDIHDDVVLVPANAAEHNQLQGLVSALGLGWSVTSSPTPPFAIIIFIKVPWDVANVRHRAVLDLLTSDGDPAHDVTGLPLNALIEFETGRPPGLTPGTPIDWTQALNIASISLEPGCYEWRLEIDGKPAARRPFTVRPNP
jgi:Family of unknown function (DUF6941)